MGSKGKIKEGDFRKDYSKVNPLWVTYKLPIKKIKDINYIEEKCSLRFTPLIRKKIRSEILSYTIMNEIQDAAPHRGGSGRVNDFFAAHIRALAKIFEDTGSKIEFKRAKKIDSPGEESHSQFSYYLRAINDIYPSHLKHSGDGFVRMARNIIYLTRKQNLKITR